MIAPFFCRISKTVSALVDNYSELEFDLAIADYDRAIKLDQNNSYFFSNRGNANMRKGQFDLAIADDDKAIELYPLNYRAYNISGYSHFMKGDIDKAIADYATVPDLKADRQPKRR